MSAAQSAGPGRRGKRDLLSLFDLGSGDEIRRLVARALELKQERQQSGHGLTAGAPLRGKTIGMIFEKASTRTRVSFEVAAHELGGYAVYLSPQGTQIGRGEPLRDTARVLGAYCHAIVIRTYGQEIAEELARFAPVPVINGLTDLLHPTQVLADLMTVAELHGAQALQPCAPPGVKVQSSAVAAGAGSGGDGGPPGGGAARFAWIGDGNNMAHSWINAAALLGLDLALAFPLGRDPDAEVLARAQRVAATTGARLTLTHEPSEAAAGRHVLSTDVWASMGEEPQSEAEARRLRNLFSRYCIDDALLRRADPRALVLHCLPAHRGEEITDAVLEGSQSAVFVQAENRLHMAKALLELLVAS